MNRSCGQHYMHSLKRKMDADVPHFQAKHSQTQFLAAIIGPLNLTLPAVAVGGCHAATAMAQNLRSIKRNYKYFAGGEALPRVSNRR